MVSPWTIFAGGAQASVASELLQEKEAAQACGKTPLAISVISHFWDDSHHFKDIIVMNILGGSSHLVSGL